MASLKLCHIYKVYDNGHKAVNDFNIDIQDKEFIVFVGPSGCGKSTTLRMIAGLEDITAGDLFIEDTLVNDMEPKDRNIAMVFQNYALYPHMTVYENMAFGLRNKHIPKEVIDEKVKEAAKILDITDYLDRKPKAMSGGQRQRVALGRAIVRDPKVFLLDEPLSNLDAKLRAQMRTEITKLHKKLGTTFIYVTHDQVEAMTMGTRIVVMKLGYVQQIDTPMNLYDKPHNAFVGGFIGTPQMNFFDVKLLRKNNSVEMELINKEIVKIPFEKVCKINESYLTGEKKVIFGIRPEHITLSEGESGVPCIVSAIERLGNESIIYGDVGDANEEFTMADTGRKVVIKIVSNPNINVGDLIHLNFNFDKAHYFDGENEDQVTLIEDIPNYSEVKVSVDEMNATLLGSTVDLPNEIASKVYTKKDIIFDIAPEAVVPGNDFTLPVIKVEQVEDKRLAYLDNDGHMLFALVDESVKEKSKYSFSLKYDQIIVKENDTVILDKLSNKVNFVGKFEKDETKERFNSLSLFVSKAYAPIVDGEVEIFGKKVYLGDKTAAVCRGREGVTIEMPVDAIIDGNDFALPVLKVRKVNGKNIATLDAGNKLKVYAVVDDSVMAKDELKFSINYKKICLKDNGAIIAGDFNKHDSNPRVLHFYLVINGKKFEIIQNNGYKMNAVEGNQCYVRYYRYELDRDDISLKDEGIEGTVTRILDYGYKKYAEVKIGEESVIINDNRLKSGDLVHIYFDGEKAAIYSIDNDMKIV